MTPLALGIIVSAAAATVALMMVSALSTVAWPSAERRFALLQPRRRANVLATWRLAPAMAAVATATMTLVAFLRFEPPDARETLGTVLPLVALVGVVSAVAGLIQVARAYRQTAQSLLGWTVERAGLGRALPIVAVDVPYPVVAVVGVLQPRLYVAKQVVADCDRGELDAMIAHEAAHVAAGDNIVRLLFAGAPVVPFMSQTWTEIEGAWVAASEEAADDAARQDQRAALALASALTKVARMATGRAPLLHASAILSGNGVERRVRRLLEPVPEPRQTRASGAIAGCLAGTAFILLLPPMLRGAYYVAEYSVRYLP